MHDDCTVSNVVDVKDTGMGMGESINRRRQLVWDPALRWRRRSNRYKRRLAQTNGGCWIDM